MRTYFAKAHIGFASGIATYGETLTDAQLAALGEARVNELVENGSLGVMEAPSPVPFPDADGSDTSGQTPDAADEGKTEEAVEPASEDDPDDEAEDDPMDEAAMDDLVAETHAETEPTQKKGRKSK